jgi:hypothetical protein
MDKYISLDRVKEVFDYAEQEFCECDYAVKNTREAVESLPAADVVPASVFRDCRNELCLKCGAYTQKHLGACDGCRWRETNG